MLAHLKMGLSEELGTLHWGKEFQVSLSSLETGEKNFRFLFSIGLFGISTGFDLLISSGVKI